jgi:hypothetical protein
VLHNKAVSDKKGQISFLSEGGFGGKLVETSTQ